MSGFIVNFGCSRFDNDDKTAKTLNPWGCSELSVQRMCSWLGADSSLWVGNSWLFLDGSESAGGFHNHIGVHPAPLLAVTACWPPIWQIWTSHQQGWHGHRNWFRIWWEAPAWNTCSCSRCVNKATYHLLQSEVYRLWSFLMGLRSCN